MPQPTPAPRPEGTTIQADGKKSINDYAATFYHDPALGTALASVQQKLSVTDPAKPQPKGTILQIPGTLVGKGNSKTGGYQIDAAYRRTGAVILVPEMEISHSQIEAPAPGSKFPMVVHQIVNEPSNQAGEDNRGWVRNLWIGPAGCSHMQEVTWSTEASLVVQVRFLSNPKLESRSQRTDPPWGVVPRPDFTMTPKLGNQLNTGVIPKTDSTSQLSSAAMLVKEYTGSMINIPCAQRADTYLITKHIRPGDPAFILTLLLGIGGGDRCEVSVTTSDPSKGYQSTVTFENWRRINYDIIAPKGMEEPYLNSSIDGAISLDPKIEKFLESTMAAQFIHLQKEESSAFLLSANLLGSVSGDLLNFTRKSCFIGSPEFLKNLPQLQRTRPTNQIAIVFVDAFFEYYSTTTPTAAIVAVTGNGPLQVYKNSSPREIAYFSPIIPTSAIRGKKPGESTLDLTGATFRAFIKNPSNYHNTPKLKWDINEVKNHTKIQPGDISIRICDSRQDPKNTSQRATILDQSGAPLEIIIHPSREDFSLPLVERQKISAFLTNSLIRENLRGSSFQIEATYLHPQSEDSAFPSLREASINKSTIAKFISEIKMETENHPAFKTKLYTHPGLSDTGTPLQGPLLSNHLTISSISTVTSRFPHSNPGEPLEIGDIIEPFESENGCPIILEFKIYSEGPIPGGRIPGTPFIAVSGGVVNKSNRSHIDLQSQMCKTILHELGHAFGLTAFSNAISSSASYSGWDLPNQIPGIKSTPDIDHGGIYYADRRVSPTIGSDGIREGHTGPHCANGLTKMEMSTSNFSKLTNPNSECVMFGQLGRPEDYCQICKSIIRSRSLENIHLSWKGRS
ncbi:MAG TPA: hypothetical protein PKO15_14195 [Fibrobacteria bacterium]|nr:hypothetical protein [Fibrobacteria bacterium]HOX50325.1 hypothetical protein [Fibrobacteria bacterium]